MPCFVRRSFPALSVLCESIAFSDVFNTCLKLTRTLAAYSNLAPNLLKALLDSQNHSGLLETVSGLFKASILLI